MRQGESLSSMRWAKWTLAKDASENEYQSKCELIAAEPEYQRFSKEWTAQAERLGTLYDEKMQKVRAAWAEYRQADTKATT